MKPWLQQTNLVEYFILHLTENLKVSIMKIILKRDQMLPPDIEKDNIKLYNQNSKYNLANPISYSKNNYLILFIFLYLNILYNGFSSI